MIAILLDPILPVFVVPVLGFVLSFMKVFEARDAASINRFAFFVAVPALLFGVLVRADTSHFQWTVLGGYFASEIVVYALGTFVARTFFGFRGPEALLLGMAACFSNHILFVLPIALRLYGEAAGLPIAAIITLDSALVFGLTIVALEFLAVKGGNPLKVLVLLAKNPMMLATFAGLVVNASGVTLPSAVTTFTGFAGAAAAPVALFALGVLLARSSPFEIEPVAMAITVLKLALVPAILWLAYRTFGISGDGAGRWPESAMLVAAGPCGAMPFILAMQYGVRADVIAKAIVYSTILSIFTLALVA